MRDHLGPAEGAQLFTDIAQHFKLIVQFPQNEIDGFSDEQYVRNIFDSLFRLERYIGS